MKDQQNKAENVSITLRYQGKEYTYEEAYEPWINEDGTVGRTSQEVAEWMYNDGNWACDCNRSLELSRRFGVGREELEAELKPGENIDDYDWELPCGDTIELVSPRNDDDEPALKVNQRPSGLYVVERK